MQSHLGRLTVDTNAARSHHSRAISEPTIDRPQFEEPVLVPSNGNSLRPRSTSNYAAAAESPRLNLSEHASPYQLTSSSIAHLSPAAHSILINGAHQEDVQAHSPVPFSPVADDSFQHSPVYPAPSNKAWSLYQGNGDKHDRPSQADLEFRPRSAVSEPGRDIHDHSEQRSNMSAFEYMFPAGVGHFSQGPHYDTVLQSSFQGKTDPSNDGRFAEDADSSAVPPDYNSIPVPEVPHLDQAPRSSIETDEDRYYNRPMSASPAASLPSPHQSPVDHEIMRQRRQYHQSRRLAKSQSRARSQGSPSSSYFPEQARGRDVGLGIHMSPEPGMTPPPTSAHYSQQGMPTLIEGYHHDSRATTPTHPSYLEHYAHSPTGNGSFEMPMNMPMPTSHPIYQPSPLPSMSGLVEPGTPERQHPHSSHGTPTGSPGVQDHVRVLGSRPKPQCWDHGCNGRQFSTFSNLLRHQREKSGTSTKSYCPRCGAEFTRTTARNGHMAHEKCKSRRSS